MLETVIAVLFITFFFLATFQLSLLLTSRVLADHAAARAARARAVGLNEFMCEKAARVAVIPVAGPQVWPVDNDGADEFYRIPTYLASEDWSCANGVLDYEYWHSMGFSAKASLGMTPTVETEVSVPVPRQLGGGEGEERMIRVEGKAEVEAHFPYYMMDQGL